MSTIYELAQRAPYTLIVGTAPTINQSLDWTARSVRIDNFSNQTVYLDDADTYVPTKTFGMIIPIVANRALASFKAPPMSPDPAPVNGQICRVTFYEDELHPSPGFTPAASLDPDGADIQPIGPSALPGAVGLAADSGHVHPGTLLDALGTDIQALGITRAAGAKGLASDAGHVHPGMWLDARTYGWDDSGVSDSSGALLQAIADLPANGGVILLPKKGRLSSVVGWDTKPVWLLGMGSGQQPGTGGTLITVDAGVSAFNPRNGVGGLGARSRITNMRIVSGTGGPGGGDVGILLQCNEGHLEDLVIEHFGQWGVSIDSRANDIAHNANNCSGHQVRIYQCFSHGWVVLGPNSNAGMFSQLDLDHNGQDAVNGGFGIVEGGYLGNVYSGLHLAGNGSGGINLQSGGSRVRMYGVYWESENKPALQIDAGNGGSNIVDFTNASRPDSADPIVDNSGARNFVAVEQNGLHWSRFIVARQAAAGGPVIDLNGLTGLLSLFAGAQLQLQNPAATANWFASVLADNRMQLTSAQAADLFLSGSGFHATGVGTFDAGVGLETAGHNHGHTHGNHAHLHSHVLNPPVGAIVNSLGFDAGGNLVTQAGPVSATTATDNTAATPALDATGESATHTHKG